MELLELKEFLKTSKLEYEEDIDTTIVLKDNHRIIATASSSYNIIKCVGIDPNYQGQNLLATLMSEMIKRLAEKGISHYFVYTKDDQADLFKALGLKKIVQTIHVALFESGASIETKLNDLKTEYQLSNKPKAAVVVNANPMTKGHYHLIKTVAENHPEVLVFVVSEERSTFPFKARFNIVKNAVKSLSNVTVLPTLEYLVSYATFPKYFMKKETNIREEHAMIDVLIFKEYYMKIFNIQHRYVGEEPLSPMTNIYNSTMKKYLQNRFHIIPRKTLNKTPISASTVRKLMRKNGLDAIKPYVVDETLEYLATEEGIALLDAIKRHVYRH